MTAVDLASVAAEIPAANGPNADVLAAISKWQDLRQSLVNQGRYAEESMCDRVILQLLEILRERSEHSAAATLPPKSIRHAPCGLFARPWIGAEPWARWPGDRGAT